MKKYKFLIGCFCLFAAAQSVSAQEVLPGITVKEFSGKIIVSWQNAYNVPVSNISIQRSYDSTKNYSTIGTVLNPQNLENGFADDRPPYNKMYYRLFISFEGGSYLFSNTARPIRIAPVKIINTVPEKNTGKDSTITSNPKDSSGFSWQIKPLIDSIVKIKKDSAVVLDPGAIPYPSQRIFTGKENNLVIHLPDAASKKYTVKFFDENNNFLFELTKLKEEFLIVEKVNFVHSGWFHFELSENAKLIEKNKFYIGKDGKNTGSDSNKRL